MFEPKIKLKKSLYEKLQQVADLLGCSVEEYVDRIVEREVDRELSKTGSKEVSQAEVDDIANKLKGLGYLD